MEMFVQVSENRIIPTRGIVDISIFPESEGGWDDEMQEPILAHPLRVHIVTNATNATRLGDDEISPYVIVLRGTEAQTFLDALPIYSPAQEEVV